MNLSQSKKALFISASVATIVLVAVFFVVQDFRQKATQNTTSEKSIISDIIVHRTDLNQALDNLSGLLSQARLSPILSFDGRAVNGFQLDHIEPGSFYQKLGLHTGDKILSINNKKLFSPRHAMELYNTIKKSDKIQMAIDRQGTLITLNFVLK